MLSFCLTLVYPLNRLVVHANTTGNRVNLTSIQCTLHVFTNCLAATKPLRLSHLWTLLEETIRFLTCDFKMAWWMEGITRTTTRCTATAAVCVVVLDDVVAVLWECFESCTGRGDDSWCVILAQHDGLLRWRRTRCGVSVTRRDDRRRGRLILTMKPMSVRWMMRWIRLGLFGCLLAVRLFRICGRRWEHWHCAEK